MEMQDLLIQWKTEVEELKSSKHWETAEEFLSGMNKAVFKQILKASALDEFTPVMVEFVPHAIEQGKQALIKAKKSGR